MIVSTKCIKTVARATCRIMGDRLAVDDRTALNKNNDSELPSRVNWAVGFKLPGTFHLSIGHCLSVVIIGLALVASSSAWSNDRIALIIGNSQYQNLQPIHSSVPDAEAMARQFSEFGYRLFGGEAHLNLTRRKMIEVLTSFSTAARENDVAFVYFSGYGLTVDGESYLLPVDLPASRLDQVKENSVNIEKHLMSLSSSVRQLLGVFDANRRIDEGELNLIEYSLKTGEKVSSGLAAPQSIKGTALLAYGHEEQQEKSLGQLGGSYTKALLERLEASPPGAIDMYSLLRDIARNQSQMYEVQVPPIFAQGVSTGTLSLQRGVEISSDREEGLLSGDREVRRWREAKKSDTVAAYQSYVRSYPNGSFKVFAMRRLASLRSATVNSKPQGLPRLTVNVKPNDAIVRFLGRSTDYHDQMELPGNADYRILIARDGYQSVSRTIELENEDLEINVNLMKVGSRNLVSQFFHPVTRSTDHSKCSINSAKIPKLDMPLPDPSDYIQMPYVQLKIVIDKLSLSLSEIVKPEYTLKEAAELIYLYLFNENYINQSFYQKQDGCGLVLLTRVEKIDEKGRPIGGEKRFSTESPIETDLLSWFKSLFFSPPGYYRFFVISLADAQLEFSNAQYLSDKQASSMLKSGVRLISDSSASGTPLEDRFGLEIAVYELRKEEGDSQALLSSGGNIDLSAHLLGANIQDLLGKF